MGYYRHFFYLLSLFLLPFFTVAQQTAISPFGQSACVSNELHTLHAQRDPDYLQNLERHERYYRNLLKDYRKNNQLLDSRSSDGNCYQPYIIPVVVHVIHLGETLGSGSNIPDSQIEDAIDGLNQYFANISGLGANIEMAFHLAKRNPNGQATNGIVRVDGSGISKYANEGITWDGTNGADEKAVKDLSKWPIDQYYNIWVVHDIYGSTAGYAYYPTSSYAYDGTVIESRYMKGKYSVLTHEVGHGFNLRHTFEGDGGNQNCPGNNNCELDGDKVCDTPPHKQGDCGSSNPCSNSGIWDNSRRNFMSYCGGANRFTEGQRIRVLAALKSVRAPLLESTAAIPVDQQREVGIVEMNYPGNGNGRKVCSSTFQPRFLVRNYGSRPVQSLLFDISLDGTLIGQGSFSGNISKNKETYIDLQAISVQDGAHTLQIELIDINGQGKDSFSPNDIVCQNFETAKESNPAALLNFENQALPVSWQVNSPDFPVRTTTIEGCNGNGQQAWLFENNGYGSAGTYTASVIWEPMDLSQTTFASLSFDIATREEYYCNVYVSLDVSVSTDCGQNFTSVLYKNNARKACGGSLPSASPLHTVSAPGNSQAAPFVPNNCLAWRHETVDLDDFIGQKVIVKFTVEKTYSISQNLFLDNVHLESCALNAIANKTDISCFGQKDGMIMVETSGEFGDVSFEWNTKPTSNNSMISQLGAGQYVCVLTDSAMCVDTVEVNIEEPAELTLGLDASNISCGGNQDGQIASHVNGGVQPYSYTWTNGSSDSAIKQLESGTFGLTVTDAHGCTRQTETTITSPDPIQLDISTTPSATNNGTAAVIVRGGIEPYSYKWSTNPVQTGNTATHLSPGMYLLTVTDANNCSQQDSVFIDAATAIEDFFPGMKEANIFPNPFENSLILELEFDQPQPFSIKLYDLNGKLVFEEKLDQNFSWKKEIPAGHIARGMYLLKLQGRHTSFNLPLIRK